MSSCEKENTLKGTFTSLFKTIELQQTADTQSESCHEMEGNGNQPTNKALKDDLMDLMASDQDEIQTLLPNSLE